VEVAVADCPNCKEKTPVIVELVPLEALGDMIEVVYCPICSLVINSDAEISVEYFNLEDLPSVGWKAVKDE